MVQLQDTFEDGNLDHKLLFEKLPALFLILSIDLRIVTASENYLKATRTQLDHIKGRNIFDVFPDNPNDPSANGVANLRASLHRVIQTGRADAMAVQKYDIPIPEEEGGGFEVRFWSPVNSPLFDSKQQLRFIIHRAEDVTSFVRLQQEKEEQRALTDQFKLRLGTMETDIIHRSQELQRSNEKLRQTEANLQVRNRELQSAQEELAAINEELVSSNEELLALNEQLEATGAKLQEALAIEKEMVAIKSRIVSIASHEFRTPLSVVSMTVEFLRKYRTRMSENEMDKKLELLMRQVSHIKLLLDDLLVMGRAESGKMEIRREWIDLPTYLSTLTGEVRRAFNDTHTIDLQVNGRFQMETDERFFRTIVTNLVSNAIKYSPQADRIEVKVEQNASGEISLTIRDFGIGIPEESMIHLFEPWHRANNVRSIQGNGLGLSIVKKSVELLKGAIQVDSKAGFGTVFTVLFPPWD